MCDDLLVVAEEKLAIMVVARASGRGNDGLQDGFEGPGARGGGR